MSGVAKVLCKCPHPQQDAMHGNQRRVANATQRSDGVSTVVRCTVCKAEHRVAKDQVKQ